MDTAYSVAIAFIVAALLILVPLGIRRVLTSLRQRSPSIEPILTALTPWINTAILAGEKLAASSLSKLEIEFEAADKKKIADSFYDILPNTLMVGEISIPISIVKRVVTREAFEAEVMNVYNAAHAFILQNEKYLEGQVLSEEESNAVKPAVHT